MKPLIFGANETLVEVVQEAGRIVDLKVDPEVDHPIRGEEEVHHDHDHDHDHIRDPEVLLLPDKT